MWSLLSRIATAVLGQQEAPLEISVSGVEGPNIGVVDRYIRQSLWTNPLDKPFKELRKTRFERAMCAAAERSLNDIRVALDLPALYLPARRIHVLDGVEFLRLFGPDTNSLGYSLGTHAYIPRSNNRLRFAATVTHEMVHLTCFKRFRVVVTEAVEEEEVFRADVTVTPTRFGLRLGKESYEGLNEAVTEIMASAVRDNLSSVRSPLTTAEIEELTCWTGYDPQIQLFEALAERIWDDDVQGFRVAMWDYMTGTDCFLRAVRRELGKTVLPTLRTMSPLPGSALATAQALDFDELAESIAKDFPEDGE